jgi:hypothetical protein
MNPGDAGGTHAYAASAPVGKLALVLQSGKLRKRYCDIRARPAPDRSDNLPVAPSGCLTSSQDGGVRRLEATRAGFFSA